MSTAAGTAPAHVGTHVEHYDPVGIKIGMWLFLFTELMLFGALFIAFAVYHNVYPSQFAEGSHALHRPIGATNTVVLLTSSLTVALGIGALERGDKRKATLALVATIGFALLFLVFKGFEWGEKLSHGVYPSSPAVRALAPGLQVFYGLYFSMTGLHALHVLIGGVVLGIALHRIRAGKTSAARPLFLVNAGLYWHLVDLVWIYLFPLFYLVS